MPTNRKTHLVVAQEDVTVTSCGELTKRRSITTHPEDVTCEDCGVTAEADQPSDGPEATTQPPVLTGKLKGDDLIARKRLAGAGRTQEAGTAFGSRWTDAERGELQTLFDEVGRAKAATMFVEANPHRTVAGALYQIGMRLKKGA